MSCITMMIILYIGIAVTSITPIMIQQQQAVAMQLWLSDGMIIFQKIILEMKPNRPVTEHGLLEIAGDIIVVIFGCHMRQHLCRIQPGSSMFQMMMDMTTIISMMED